MKKHGATQVGPGLWVGTVPPAGPEIGELGFDVIVFAAKEHQPPSSDYPGVEVVRVPLKRPKDHLKPKQAALAREGSHQIAELVEEGARVLIACDHGRNRSAFLAARTLVELGEDPTRAIQQIREARGEDALSRLAFLKELEAA